MKNGFLKKPFFIDEHVLRELYLHKTGREIASLYNVSLFPIKKLLKKYSISKL
jgi:hypothetical protein